MQDLKTLNANSVDMCINSTSRVLTFFFIWKRKKVSMSVIYFWIRGAPW